MNFLGIGMGELLLILIIAAMVVGPERMVELSRTAGKLLGRLRRETDSITKEFREAISTFDDVGQVANEAKSALGDITGEVAQASKEMRQTAQEVQQAAQEVKQTASDAKAAAISAGSAAPKPVSTPKPVPAAPVAAIAGPIAQVSAQVTGYKPPAPVAQQTPTPAAAATSPTPPKPKVSLTPLLDGEIEVDTPAVARAALRTDEATEVGLASLVPDSPADYEPVDVQQPTLMVALPPVVENAPAPDPAAPAPEAQPAPAAGEPAGSQG